MNNSETEGLLEQHEAKYGQEVAELSSQLKEAQALIERQKIQIAGLQLENVLKMEMIEKYKQQIEIIARLPPESWHPLP